MFLFDFNTSYNFLLKNMEENFLGVLLKLFFIFSFIFIFIFLYM